MKKQLFIIFLLMSIGITSAMVIPIDTIHYNISSTDIIDFKERKCIKGEGILKNTTFVNGIIEFDFWTTSERAYPGIKFRLQPDGTSEHLYIRPHASGKDIAVQYAPAFYGETCWQLYHGKDFTAKYTVPLNRWVHFKALIVDNTVKLYLDNSVTPILESNLVNITKEGNICFSTTGKETYFSNINIETTENKIPDKLPVLYSVENKEWEISKLLNSNIISSDDYPRFFSLFFSKWEKVDSDINGMLNISRYRKPVPEKKDCVYARKLFYSEKDDIVKMAFGYSDAVKIFLNEQVVYSGNYAYKSRGSTFSGNIGLNDTLYLNIRKGLNEIFIVSKNRFGGWGFISKPEHQLLPVPDYSKLAKNNWKSKKGILLPESTAYDKKRGVIYYSNFDPQGSKKNYPSGSVSVVDMSGKHVETTFIDSLYSPTGLCVYDDKLYVTERDGISIFSIADKKLLSKCIYPKEMKFANDIAIADNGDVFITNTDKRNGVVDIYIMHKNKITPWLASEQLSQVNGLLFDDGYLVVGNSGKNLLQKINSKTKEIKTITCLGSGVIDGIKKYDDESYLVSLWRGELLRIRYSGEIEYVLRSDNKFNIADFDFDQEKGLLFIPTFLGKNIACYQINN